MIDTSNFFDAIYNNSAQNAIMIMDAKGIIKEVNPAFTIAYGYTTEDLQGKHFKILYTEKDQTILRPEIELNTTHRQGFCGDENYLVHKDSSNVWVTGESILVKTESGTSIVKIIHNIHAQKQLERYLLASTELLDNLFESVHSGLMLLDSQARVVKTNASFRKMFDLATPLLEGSKVQEIANPFWHDDELRKDIRNAVVNGERINKEYITGNEKSNFRRFHIDSKLMVAENTMEKRLLLLVKEA
jgi:PAS domain S-box-containing protein